LSVLSRALSAPAASFGAALLAFGFAGTAAIADPITLSDNNSLVRINASGNPNGMYEWTIFTPAGAFDQLAKQWFWYRTAGMTREQPLNALHLVSAQTFDNVFAPPPPSQPNDPQYDPSEDQLLLTYQDSAANPTFEIMIYYALAGGNFGTFTATMSEQIFIKNLSPANPLSLSFFQYSDFNLGSSAADDSMIFTPTNRIRQEDPTGINFSEAVVSGDDLSCEIDTVTPGGAVDDTLERLNDNAVNNLTGCAAASGPADLSWAFQWNFNLAPDEQAMIIKSKSMEINAPLAVFSDAVPEPASLALFGMGVFGLAAVRRWKSYRP
jgi:hypothetical protein